MEILKTTAIYVTLDYSTPQDPPTQRVAVAHAIQLALIALVPPLTASDAANSDMEETQTDSVSP